MRFVIIAFLLCVAGVPGARAVYEVAIEPANRLAPEAADWRGLAEAFARQPELTADFVERRHFPFRSEAVVLKGEVRLSRAHGLSLRYTAPEERIVILDQEGVLMRETSGQKAPPDPRAAMANAALFHILRFDFAALEKEFELYGRKVGDEWSIALVPRAEAMRKAIGNIYVAGEKAEVRSIELRRSVKQHIDIEISAARPTDFTPEDRKRYFR
jgi:hypothetical protein